MWPTVLGKVTYVCYVFEWLTLDMSPQWSCVTRRCAKVSHCVISSVSVNVSNFVIKIIHVHVSHCVIRIICVIMSSEGLVS